LLKAGGELAERELMNLMRINPDEIRSIVGKLVAQGRAVVPPEKPKRGKYSGRTREQNKLRVIACDQCGKRFMKNCSVHLRCSKECSRKANIESVRVWFVSRGLRGKPLADYACDNCGTVFRKINNGHRFCGAECRKVGKKFSAATKPTKTKPTTSHGHTK
jgi:hypothetical protein